MPYDYDRSASEKVSNASEPIVSVMKTVFAAGQKLGAGAAAKETDVK